MPKGGSRHGAGRKVGSKTKKTRKVAIMAAAEGVTRPYSPAFTPGNGCAR